VPAEAEREARELIAIGDAAPVAEEGKAGAAALHMLAEAWSKAGTNAREVFLIQQIEGLMETVVDSVKGIDVGEVNLLDSGDGKALPAYVSAFPATVNAVLSELKTTTGVDIPGVLAGTKRGSRTPSIGSGGGGHHG